MGTPHRPNPPTARVAPSGMSATASPALATTLSTSAPFRSTARSVPSAGCPPSQRPEDVLDPRPGVAEQHAAVLAEEQWVLHAGVARRHGALEHHHVLGLPDVQHRHAGDRAAGVV